MINNFDNDRVCGDRVLIGADDATRVANYLGRVGAWVPGPITRPSREQYRAAWSNFVSSGAPCCMMITVPIHVRLSDRESYRVLNRIVKRMNSALFTRRGKKRGMWLEGFFVGEQYRLHRTLRGCLHWHIVIRKRAEAPLLNRKEVLVAFQKAVAYVNWKARKLITSINEDESVKSIHDQDGAVSYSQKELNRFDCETGDQFGFLCADGLSGFCLDDRRKSLTG